MIPLYDAHNHLQDERLSGSIARLPAIGLRACVVNGTCEKDWPRVAELAQKFNWVIPAFGLHPWNANERSPQWFDTLRRFLDATPRACVGEVGLDRWMRDPDVADQEEVFARQMELAAERNSAVSIHCLKAWGPLENVLKRGRRPERGFLLHSYGGSREMASVFAKLGGYFSISGYFAHERKAAQREVFKAIPIERLLVETDAPDMAGPFTGGDLNAPSNILPTYEFAAKLRGMALDDFAQMMEQNFQRLFRPISSSGSRDTPPGQPNPPATSSSAIPPA